jgi:arylsulfatase A-like enzyme
VGEVLGALKRHSLDNDTLVLFSSDNGPWYQGSSGRLRGRKGMTWEGGVRVPFIARQAGAIKPGVSDAVVSLMDVMPTVAARCGGTPRNPVDGVNASSLLDGSARIIDRELLLYFDGWNLQCARQGDWKIHFARYNNVTYSPPPAAGRQNLKLPKAELYNLKSDPDESYDVAAEHPDRVRNLTARAEALVKGFPEPVRQAWAETAARPVRPTNAGAQPQLPANP